jgi:hypothetical protein
MKQSMAPERDEAFEGRAFFEVLLPQILADLGPSARKVDGVVQFDLGTDEGVLEWFVDFRSIEPTVIAGEHPSPDLTFMLAERLVLPMLLGTLDVRSAEASGDVDVGGDPGVLERLSQLMSAGRSGMSAQYMRFDRQTERGSGGD